MKSLSQKVNEKLGPKFFSPCVIMERWTSGLLNCPNESLPITSNFSYIIALQPLGVAELLQDIPPLLTEELQWVTEPQEVLSYRRGSQGIEVLIKWGNLSEFESSWESASKIQEQLSDKLEVIGRVLVRCQLSPTSVGGYRNNSRHRSARTGSAGPSSAQRGLVGRSPVRLIC